MRQRYAVLCPKCKVRLEVKTFTLVRIEQPKRAAKKSNGNGKDWTVIDKVLGTMSDVDIAKKFHAHPMTLYLRRHKLGIKRFIRKGYAKPKPERKHKRSYSKINWKRIEKWFGKMRDTAIAKRFGVNPFTVMHRRRKLGFKRFVG